VDENCSSAPPSKMHLQPRHSRRAPGPDDPRSLATSVSRRIRVHLHRGRLDRQLADGCAPDEFADLAIRAEELADPLHRRRVARSLRRLVEQAELSPAARVGSAAPVWRPSVVRWREGVLGLAERLERPAPVDPCGVARALLLLSDGGGPFYNGRAAHSMSNAIWWIADGLQRQDD
jgi:hypothetical protein